MAPPRRSTRRKEPKKIVISDLSDSGDVSSDEMVTIPLSPVIPLSSTRSKPRGQRRATKTKEPVVDPISAPLDYLEITLDNDTSKPVTETTTTKSEPSTKPRIERTLRTVARHVHLACLLIAYSVKSKVLQTPLLKAMILSKVPPHLLRQFAPEIIEDGRTFLNALSMLSNWWKNGINRQSPEFSKKHSNNQSHFRRLLTVMEKKSGQDEDLVCVFTFLLLALGLEARFVASLQPILVRPDVEDAISPVTSSPPMTKKSEMKRVTKTVIQDSTGIISVQSSSSPSQSNTQIRSSALPPPRFWCEVWHPREQKWIPVDCLRAIVNDRLALEPPSKNSHQHMFVIAFRQGIALDVTRRYCSRYFAHTLKLRRMEEAVIMFHLSRFGGVMSVEEDEQLASLVDGEPLPITAAGFHGHGRYMLESKLKKYEAYWPPDAGIIGEFRGENVRLRSVVQKVRSKEAWYTQFGRIIKEGEESCKQVKLPKKPEKKRRKFDDEIPMVGPEDAEDVRWQPLYGEWQTEPYSPPIAQDGKVPRNKFGSVDLYLPSMMPIGCVWIKHEHAYIAARDLGVDYAAACVCFAFSGRIAVPRMRGIVICAEYEGSVRKRLKEVEHELICAAAEAEIEAEKKKTRLEKRKKKIMDKIVGEHNIDDQETPGEIISALDPKSKHHLNQLDDNLDDLF